MDLIMHWKGTHPMAKTLTELAAEIISAMATNTSMTLDELEHNLSQVFASLKRISEQEIAAAPAPEPKTGGRSKRGSRVTVTDPSAAIRCISVPSYSAASATFRYHAREVGRAPFRKARSA